MGRECWPCKKCGTVNKKSRITCRKCGASKHAKRRGVAKKKQVPNRVNQKMPVGHFLFLVGVPGIEPESQDPQPCILTTILHPGNYLIFPRVLIHLVQALTLFPSERLAHCRLGYFFFFPVGLYLPRSFFLVTATIGFLPQIEHLLDILRNILSLNM